MPKFQGNISRDDEQGTVVIEADNKYAAMETLQHLAGEDGNVDLLRQVGAHVPVTYPAPEEGDESEEGAESGSGEPAGAVGGDAAQDTNAGAAAADSGDSGSSGEADAGAEPGQEPQA